MAVYFPQPTCALSLGSLLLQNHLSPANEYVPPNLCVRTALLPSFLFTLVMRTKKKKRGSASSKYPEETAITSIYMEMEMCGDGVVEEEDVGRMCVCVGGALVGTARGSFPHRVAALKHPETRHQATRPKAARTISSLTRGRGRPANSPHQLPSSITSIIVRARRVSARAVLQRGLIQRISLPFR